MRIAALYDIHGNLPALEAVLADVKEAEADTLLIGGDVVPGPMPSECLDLIAAQELPTRFIRGNGEADVVAVYDGEIPTRVPDAFRGVIRWVAERLSRSQRDWLASWPLTASLPESPWGEVLFCHATPRDDNEIFTERTPTERLLPVFEATGASVVICGHTHMPFDRAVGAIRIVNAGSVGLPFGDPAASWALVEPDAITLRRTDYDVDRATARAAATGYPIALDLARPPSAVEMRARFEAVAIGS